MKRKRNSLWRKFNIILEIVLKKKWGGAGELSEELGEKRRRVRVEWYCDV